MFTLLTYQLLILGILSTVVGVGLFLKKKPIIGAVVSVVGVVSAGYGLYLLLLVDPGVAVFLPQYLPVVPFLSLLVGVYFLGAKQSKETRKRSAAAESVAAVAAFYNSSEAPQDAPVDVSEEAAPADVAAPVEPVKTPPTALPHRPVSNPDSKYKLPF